MSGSLFNRVREMNRVVGGAAHHCASPGAAERIQDWVLGGVAADTDRRSFGARRPHASRSHQHTTYAEPLGGVGGRREQEGRVLAIAGVDTAPGRVRPEANPLVDATSTRGREPPHHQAITHIDKEKTKKRSKELDNCGHIEGLLDSRVVDVTRSCNPIFITISSLKPFLFNDLIHELRFVDHMEA
jgi:hypothetical protein